MANRLCKNVLRASARRRREGRLSPKAIAAPHRRRFCRAALGGAQHLHPRPRALTASRRRPPLAVAGDENGRGPAVNSGEAAPATPLDRAAAAHLCYSAPRRASQKTAR